MQYNAQLYERSSKVNKLETISFWIMRQFSIYDVSQANAFLKSWSKALTQFSNIIYNFHTNVIPCTYMY